MNVERKIKLLRSTLERHNRHLQEKLDAITSAEVRWVEEWLDDAEICVVAYGTAARVASTAIERARARGLRAGLFRPVSLWPFAAARLAELAERFRAILVVELSAGQMVEDVRLAAGRAPVFFHGRTGGMVPTPRELVDRLRLAWAWTEARS